MGINKLDKKRRIIDIIKFAIICVIVFSFLLLFFPSKILVVFSFILICLFSLISLFYYSYRANEDDRKIIIDMWKIYYSFIFVFITTLFALLGYGLDKSIDMQKNKIDYLVSVKKKKEAEKIYQDYLETNEIIINLFSPLTIVEFFEERNFSSSSNNKENNAYIFWYINFLCLLISLMTLILFLRAIVEFNEFKK
ncbi:hypothetical protein CRV01_03055 [Arcobacter sp. CECT 8983]|uniref:hypothetical protein n=1 Tax=Arcobacter sp. CECT 8983 TaxID=2044508 RepID=UPI00100B98D4|nr:hypothetical protein [Arcobacter sp. CECT 8983]RXJ90154.1 hypothetical protein CRV01_03055 [Arcobacter sp. CECT 8983]